MGFLLQHSNNILKKIYIEKEDINQNPQKKARKH